MKKALSSIACVLLAACGGSVDDGLLGGDFAATTVTTRYKHADKELDDTGLYYYGARYYDPDTGRFLAADTDLPNVTDPQQLNRYAYVRNNPMRLVDPDGHAPVDATVVGGSPVARTADGLAYNPAMPFQTYGYDGTAELDEGAYALFVDIPMTVATGGIGTGARAAETAGMTAARSMEIGAAKSTPRHGIDYGVLITKANEKRLNLISRNDRAYSEFIVGPKSHPFVLDAHGNGYFVGPKAEGDVFYNAEEAARLIRQFPYWKGENICVAACAAGKYPDGFAQGLANEMRAGVLASDGDVAAQGGTLYPLFGKFRFFEPKEVPEHDFSVVKPKTP